MEAASQDEQTLQARLTQARERLSGLTVELWAADDTLERLGPERKQHRLLHLACGALEELGDLGAGALFWGARAAEGVAQLRVARGRVDAFDKRLREIQERRDEIVEALERAQAHAEWLEDEVFEAERQEELRRQEWLIEREVSLLPAHAARLPWARGGEDDRRLRKALAASLLVSLLLLLVIPRIELPMQELGDEVVQVPERLTRLIVKQRPLPAPPPHAATEPQQLAAQKPAPQPEAATAPRREGPGTGSGEGQGAGPARGPGQGILAFREKFSGFRETQNVARLGAQARIDGAGDAGPAQRSMVTSQAPGSSHGIDLAALSRGIGGGGGAGSGGALAGVQVARATSTIAGGGGGRAGAASGAGNGLLLGRTDEEIQIVFDRHKAALYRLYNRELRNDPTLKGQMVLRLRIEPDGSVSLCELRATDMKAPELASQVVERVRGFDFGAKDVPPVTILYPIDFLPAT